MWESDLSKSSSHKLIEVPIHPLKNELLHFGRDELYGLIFSSVTSFLVGEKITSSIGKSLIWPFSEKFWFFIPHIIYAFQHRYDKTPSQHIATILKNGGKSVIKDLWAHDPLYISLLYTSTKLLPNTPLYIINIVCFFVALVMVWIGQVEFDKLRHRLLIKKFINNWFSLECYYESRIVDQDDQWNQLLLSKDNALKIYQELVKAFSLKEQGTWLYEDTYFDTHNIGSYPNYNISLKKRKRQYIDQITKTPIWEPICSEQLVSTKLTPSIGNPEDQNNYYPFFKNKLYRKYNNFNEHSFAEINKSIWQISYPRTIAHDPQWLLVAYDDLGDNYGLIEIKVHRDLSLLHKAIAITRRHWWVQTTREKNQTLNNQSQQK